MLHPSTLDRCTHSYRRGYNAGYWGGAETDPLGPTDRFDRPFANHDYAEGVEAGKNDRHWDDKPAAERFARG